MQLIDNNNFLWLQLKREFLLHLRQPQLILNSSLFFLIISLFLPLTLPANPEILRIAAAGLIWVSMLLSMLLATLLLFQQDYEDGIIEQWLISGYPLELILVEKIFVQWLLNILPIIICCPVLAILFSFDFKTMLTLLFSLIIGTPAIFFLCALAAACCTGLAQKGILMALILLPLAIPIMVFGSSMLITAMQGFAIMGHVAILLAVSILFVSFLPFAIAAIVRINLS